MSGTDQQAPAGGLTVNLTGRAAEEVQKFIAQEQVPAESAGLRVSVLPGRMLRLQVQPQHRRAARSTTTSSPR